MIQEKDVQVTVRDGVKIAVRIYPPDGTGPYPALFGASPYRYDNNELPAQPIAHIFQRGSRIRVELCCGDSPVTDGLFFHVYRPDKIGADTIFHDADHPSHVVLPVLKTG